jgi:type I restriction enzyme S subunit
MMKKYDSYKDSGVEWIGEIPSHWNYGKLKNVGHIISGGTPSTDKEEYWGGDIPWLQSGKIQYNIIEIGDVDKYITKLGFVNSSTKLVNSDSVLIAITGATCGNVGFLKFPTTINQSIIGIEFNSSHSSFYFFYYLFIQREQIRFNITGGAQGGVTKTDVSNLFITIPPLSEQQQIVSYLDTKTSQIDSLIEKTQLKIELLKEKRTSFINEVVTKGLNPNVEMKDSGVEWIGEIPSHWIINKVGNNTYVKGRIGWKGLRSEDFIDEGPFLITGTDFNKDGSINWDKMYHVNQERYDEDPFIQLQDHDVLITKDGTIGKVVYVGNLKGPTCLNSGIFLTRPTNGEYITRYFFWMLNSDVFKVFVDYNSGGSTIQHLYQNVFVNFRFPIPPLSEQQQIVTYLDEHTQLIDQTISVEQRRIELLKEYRQSLISEVVTGKRKVTNDD